MFNTYEQVGMRFYIDPTKYVVQVPWTDFTCSASGLYFCGQIYFETLCHG